MAPMPYSDLTPQQKIKLLTLARTTIQHGTQCADPDLVDFTRHQARELGIADDELLHQPGCCFVTLHLNGKLRGCIGALTAFQPLINDVVEHAYAAAFKDYRFPPVTQEEVQTLQIDISLISPETEIPCTSEEELLSALEPHKDGLTIRDGFRQATFLPSVWEQLPDQHDFLDQLRLKAGMPQKHWSSDFKAYRYHTLSFGEGTF